MSKVRIYYENCLIDEVDSLRDDTISTGYAVNVGTEGSTERISVVGGKMEVDGGLALDTTVKGGGVLIAYCGDVEELTISLRGNAEIYSEAQNVTNAEFGSLTIGRDGIVDGLSTFRESRTEVESGGVLNHATVNGGSVVFSDGTGSHVTMEQGTVELKGCSTVSDIKLTLAESSLTVSGNSLVNHLTCNGAAAMADGNAVICDAVLTSYQKDSPLAGETIRYSGTLTLGDGSVLRGRVSLDGDSQLIAESGSVIEFALPKSNIDEGAAINDFSRVFGTPSFSMAVSSCQKAGNYTLAGNAEGFSTGISLKCEDFSSMELTLEGDSLVYHNSVYSLTFTERTLAVSVSDFATKASADALQWGAINGAENYVLELFAGEEQLLSLEVSENGVDLLGLENGNYAWQVRSGAELDNWQSGVAFSQTEAAEGPQALNGVQNGTTDLFLAKSADVWGDGYLAKHVGNGEWDGTGECVELVGKGRITDLFAGSEDASVLVLGGEGNGCALFLEDLYSAAKGGAEQARLSRVDAIVATDGDDVIDLTSQLFGFSGGVTVHGGDGNDVIWANSGENMLYGGDGDDCIVGGNGDDTIIGGSGSDTLHGGGGRDAFCFCPGWGNDVVMQSDGGIVELWFDGIHRSDLTLSADEEGHAQFSMGADNVTLAAIQFSAIQDAWLAGADVLSDTLFVKFEDGSPAGNVSAGPASGFNICP